MVRWLIPNNLLFYSTLFVSSFADQLPSFLVTTFFRYVISFYQSMKKLWCPGKHPTYLAKGVLNVQYLDKLQKLFEICERDYNLHFIRQDSVKIVCDLQHVHYLGNILIVATKYLFRDIMCTPSPHFQLRELIAYFWL